MKFFKAFLLFSVSNFVCRAVEKISSYDKGKNGLKRESRTFDEILKIYNGFKGDNEENFGNPLQSYSMYKVNNYPQFGYSNKGEYFYQPPKESFKGGFQFPIGQSQNDLSSTGSSNDGKGKVGLISSLLSEKPLAAIIPLSIFITSVVPGFMKHFSRRLTSPVQTAFSKKESREINGKLDNVLVKLIEFVNYTDSEDNFQRLVCSVFAEEAPLPELEYFEIAKFVIARLVQDEQLNRVDMKDILSYLKENSCSWMLSNADTTTENNIE